jgi:hypothetical protein
MWGSTDPDDPDGQPSGQTGGSSPADDGTPAPGDADGGSSAPAAGSGPGAVAPCPCTSATVTSEMVMEEPADRTRTRMGVGERVRVTYSIGAGDWAISGDGTLSQTNGQTVTFTAPGRGGSVTLTATGGGCSASITFTIVEPQSVHQIKKFTSAARVEHTLNMPDVGMFTNIFFGPDDVNFHWTQFLEDEVMSTSTGVWSCLNNSGHHPNANGLGFTTHVQAGMGTYADAMDHLYSGHCGIPWSAPQTGTELWPIPWRWRVGTSGAFHALTTVNQRVNCDAAGSCTISKAGATVSVLATAATSSP